MSKQRAPQYKALIATRFWETTALSDMNQAQWEALCDGCAKCCLHKVIDDDSLSEGDEYFSGSASDGEVVYFTDVTCQYLHDKDCGCTVYPKRTELVPHCVQLRKDNLDNVFYMPPSCSYRLLHEGKSLPQWHPLLNNGNKSAMHAAGRSVRGKTVCETSVPEQAYPDRIVTWPLEV